MPKKTGNQESEKNYLKDPNDSKKFLEHFSPRNFFEK